MLYPTLKQELRAILDERLDPRALCHVAERLLWLRADRKGIAMLAYLLVEVLPDPLERSFADCAERLGCRLAYAAVRFGFISGPKLEQAAPERMLRIMRRVGTQLQTEQKPAHYYTVLVFTDRFQAYMLAALALGDLLAEGDPLPAFGAALTERIIVAAADRQGLLERQAMHFARRYKRADATRLRRTLAAVVAAGCENPLEPVQTAAARRLERCLPVEMSLLLAELEVQKRGVLELDGPPQFFGPLLRNKHFLSSSRVLPDNVYKAMMN